MSRITNLSNLRIKRFNTWKSNWVENNKNYSLLFFYDFQLHQYLRGLFYRLKILTDDFYIDHLLNNFLYIKVNAFFYKFNIYNYVLNYFFDQYLFYDFFFFFYSFKFNFSFKWNYKSFYYFFFFKSVEKKNIDFYPLFFLWLDFFNKPLILNDSFLSNSNFLIKNRYFFNFLKFFSLDSIILKKKNNLKFQTISYFFYKKLNLKNKKFFYDFFYKRKFNFLKNFYFYYFFFFKFFLCFFFYFFTFNSFLYFLFKKIMFFFSYKINLFFYVLSVFSYLKQENKKFFLNDFYFLKKNYQSNVQRDVFDKKNYFDFFFFFFFFFLIFNIEKTIYFFYGSRCFFNLFFYSYSLFPSFLSSKFINDYVLFELEKGRSLYRIFKSLQFFQLKEKLKLKEDLNYYFTNFLFDFFYKSNKKSLKFLKKFQKKRIFSFIKKYNKFFTNFSNSFYFFFKELLYYELLKKKYPLIGLRIECNGTFKKGEQANLIAYHHVVKNYKLFGKMPNRSILSDIDYFQSFARTKSGSVGIKVWIFFYTKSYTSNYWLKSLI